jgi:AcrR family transcriptional regulator
MKRDKREDIIRTAMELIALNGFHDAPVATIAKQAQVATGTIYLFFDSKDDLIAETFACLEGQLLASIMAHYPEELPIRERFLHVGRKLVDYFLASPVKFRFIEQFYNSPHGMACRRDRILAKKGDNVITDLLEQGRQQQVIKDMPQPILMALAFGPLIDICRSHVQHYFTLDEATTSRMLEACWEAIRR